ncbi:hypothetical protein GHK92_08425 [Nocardioides sp. dk4132]|uniref:hypothetical protein n=1 Tax=unclassified Nocardioides TaxID=2615069 RepID=UPI001295627C|nr:MULTISPECIES: hypothetical protein [unclassified Nocardioides]MQW75896.1 hypothetical protein [Nocardioides sp. dk4132]QGA08759.1 hypothetical protein GFH29_16185 [Nocardioides sp. dk884]
MIPADVAYPDTVEALAEALRTEPVIVHETLGGGDTAGALERISRLVERMPFRTFVAVIEAPPEVDAGIESGHYLATALSRRIGEPGLYVVATEDAVTGVQVVGTDWDQTHFSLQADIDRQLVTDEAGVTILAPTVEAETILRTALAEPAGPDDERPWRDPTLDEETVEDLVAREQALAAYETPAWSEEYAAPAPPVDWSADKRWMVGSMVAGLLLAVLLQSLRGWPGWRRRPAPVPEVPAPVVLPPDLAEVRAEADTGLTELAEALVNAPAGPSQVQAALARETAEPLLRSEDVRDVVGALVLVRAGRHALVSSDPYRPCFVNAIHGAAEQVAQWQFGDAEIEVPVCAACHRAFVSEQPPSALVVRRGGRLRPYYEEDSVWARTGYGSLTTDLADLARQVAGERRLR